MKKLVFSILAVTALSFGAMAQATATHTIGVTVTEGAIIATAATAAAVDINLTGVTPGAKPDVDYTAGSNQKLQFSVIDMAGDAKISAKISAVTPLTVTATVAAPAVGSGTTAGGVALTTSDQDVLTAIATSWTGSTATDGAAFSYACALPASMTGSAATSALGTASQTLTVTYTIAN
jgi:hypothetical protein